MTDCNFLVSLITEMVSVGLKLGKVLMNTFEKTILSFTHDMGKRPLLYKPFLRRFATGLFIWWICLSKGLKIYQINE